MTQWSVIWLANPTIKERLVSFVYIYILDFRMLFTCESCEQFETLSVWAISQCYIDLQRIGGIRDADINWSWTKLHQYHKNDELIFLMYQQTSMITFHLWLITMMCVEINFPTGDMQLSVMSVLELFPLCELSEMKCCAVDLNCVIFAQS